VTGWAQVRHACGRSDADARGKLRHDPCDIKHRSPLDDLAILIDTASVALRGEGR
jgi:lipopolysaccharide/colanic/teichoic acid biosynthesis glycosyltransferase